MTTRQHLRRLLLLVLHRMDGTPCPESVLLDSTFVGLSPAPSRVDVEAEIRELDREGYLVGDLSRFDGSRTWTLSTKGAHQAKQLC